MSDIFTPSNEPLDAGANWCPDCGEPRGVCACEEMRANNPNEELDAFMWFEPDEEDWEAYDYTEGDIGQDGEI